MKKSFLFTIIIICIMLCSCSHKEMTADFEEYNQYRYKVEKAHMHMPSQYELGKYKTLVATHKQSGIIFKTDTIVIFLEYEKLEFKEQIKYINSNYNFFKTSPEDEAVDVFADINGYSIKMVNENYWLANNSANGLLIGTNEQENKICYLYYYDPDRDMLPDLDKYIKDNFYFA